MQKELVGFPDILLVHASGCCLCNKLTRTPSASPGPFLPYFLMNRREHAYYLVGGRACKCAYRCWDCMQHAEAWHVFEAALRKRWWA